MIKYLSIVCLAAFILFNAQQIEKSLPVRYFAAGTGATKKPATVPIKQPETKFACIPPVPQPGSPGDFLTYRADIPTGQIGVTATEPVDNPYDNVFHIQLTKEPLPGETVWLEYELNGVTGNGGIARSINDAQAVGGSLVQSGAGWQKQKERLPVQLVKKGDNIIRFGIPENAGYHYRVKNVSISVSPGKPGDQDIQLNAIARSEQHIYIKGICPRAGAQLFCNNLEIPVFNGEFEWLFSTPDSTRQTIELKEVLPGGYTSAKNIVLPQQQKAMLYERAFKGNKKQALFQPGKKLVILPGEKQAFAGIQLPEQALPAGELISITALRDVDVTVLNSDLVNVTRGATAYRFLPHGARFAHNAVVSIPYDTALIPEGYTEADIRTYYFNEQKREWEALVLDTIDARMSMVLSKTSHFTDMINGIIKVPESPQTQGYTPTSIKDIKAANPSAGIEMINPPAANNMGNAATALNVKLPAGRQGMQPRLAFQYNNEGGNGWTGIGWNISVPFIGIDTRWGVPRYDAALETETYTMGGEQLAPIAHKGALVARTVEKQFHPRVEGSFNRIIRHGSNPTNYWWEVTDKNGNQNFYGGFPGTGVVSNAVLKDDNGNIAYWALFTSTDLNDNTVHYQYTTVQDVGLAAGTVMGKQLYIQEIDYTGIGTKPGPYTVTFTRDRQLGEPRRKDVDISGRLGFKMVTADLLRRVTIRLEGRLIRSYELQYQEGAFYKTLLKSISERDANDSLFYTHQFSYYDDVQSQNGYVPLGGTEDWSPANDNIKSDIQRNLPGFSPQASALSTAKSKNSGKNLAVTFGFWNWLFNKSLTVGGSYGTSRSSTEGLVALVDINGDALPDKVFKKSGQLSYRPNLGATAHQFGSLRPVTGIGNFSAGNSKGSSTGLEINAWIAFWGRNTSTTTTTTHQFFGDYNGDGLIDVANNGTVYFNRLDNNGDPLYLPSSLQTPSPIPVGANVSTQFLAPDTALQHQQERDFPLQDIIRCWTAPFTGNITITAPVSLVNTGPNPKADGVRVSIQHAGNVRWAELIGPGDYTVHNPANVSSFNVTKGQRIYFRVQSVYNGDNDRVNWDPQITYNSAINPQRDANNRSTNFYRASQDYYLSYEGGSYIGKQGTLVIDGLFTKGITSDDVLLSIEQERAGVTSVVFQKTYPAGIPANEPVLASPVAVDSADHLFFKLISSSHIDRTLLQWHPRFLYSAFADGSPVLDNNGNPVMEEFPTPDNSNYNDWKIPTPLLTNATADTVYIRPYVATYPNISDTFNFTVKRVNSLAGKIEVRFITGVFTGVNDSIQVIRQPGDVLYCEYHVPEWRVADSLTRTQYIKRNSDGTADTLQAGLYCNPKEFYLGTGYRGWGHFSFKGDPTNAPLNESKININGLPGFSNDPNQYLDSALFNNIIDASTTEFIPLFADNPRGDWVGFDSSVYLNGTQMSSARLWMHDVSVDSLMSGASLTVANKISRSKVTSYALGADLEFGFFGSRISKNTSKSESTTLLDMMDMNGDRYPDVQHINDIQYTLPNGGLENLNRTHNLGGSLFQGRSKGISLGGTFQASNPKNTPSSNASNATDNASASIGISISINGSLNKNDDEVVVTWMDVNGDGLPDKVYNTGNVSLNLGYKFVAPESWGVTGIEKNNTGETGAGGGFGVNIWYTSFQRGFSVTRGDGDCSTSYEDVNGDGLVDKLTLTGGTLLVQLNTGNGFGPQINWAGLNLIRTNSSVGESSNSAFTITIPIFIFPIPHPIFKLCINRSSYSGDGVSRDKDRVMDIDGDGFADILHSENDGQLTAKRSTIGRTNMLHSVQRPMGSYFNVDYERLGNTYNLPQSKWVLKNTELFDGVTGDGADFMRNRFTYTGGLYNRNEREFYGFSTVTSEQLNTAAGNTVYRTTVRNFLNNNYYEKGLLAEESLQNAAGNKFTETRNQYQFRPVQDSVQFPALVKTDKLFYEGNATPGTTTYTEFDYDVLGNMTLIHDAGDGSAQDMLTARVTYHNNDPLYIKGIPAGIEVNTVDGLKRKRETTIDNQGNITQIRQYINNSTVARYDMTYDVLGNLAQITRPANSRNQRLAYKYKYDSITNTYVIRVDDSYGYNSSSTYDLRFGQLLSTRSIQNQPMQYTVDAKGRTTTITGPYEIAAGRPYTIAFEYHPEATVPYAITRHYDPEHNADINTVTLMDGLGRALQVKKQSSLFTGPNQPDNLRMIVSGRTYFDAFGRTTETRYPTTEPIGAANNQFTLANGLPMATSTYDVLDRTLGTVLADGATTTNTYGFNGTLFSTKTKDALQNEKEVLTDVRERNRQTNVFGGPNGTITTRFSYNGVSDLMQVTDAGGNNTSYTYDMLGRKLSVNHPDAGLTQFVYDAAGNMTEKITPQIRKEIPNGGAIKYGYDFERLADIDYPRQYQNKVTYKYGAPNSGNRTGRLILQMDASGGQEFYYGPLGEITKTIRTMLVNQVFYTTYVSEQEYDTWNRVKKMTYPDGEVVKYFYNRGGSLDSMNGYKLGNAYKYVNQVGYDEFEQRVYLQYGNGAETHYEYDNQRRRLINLKAYTATARPFMNNLYRYDAVSNILGIENNVQAYQGKLGGYARQEYDYDNLYRLTGADGWYKGEGDSIKYNLDMGYDNLYNITSKKMTRPGFNRSYDFAYAYTNGKPHQPSKIGLTDFIYDENGNQLRYGNRQYFWDEENRLMATIEKGLLSLYTYDASGERAVKSSGGVRGNWVNGAPTGVVNHHNNYTAYVSSYLVINHTTLSLNSGFTKHYYIEGQRIVSKTGIGNFTNISFSRPAITAGGIDYIKRLSELQRQRYAYYASLGVSAGPPVDKYFYAHPYNSGIAAPVLIDSTSSSIPRGWPGNTTPPPAGPPIFVSPIPGNDSVKAGYGFTATGHFYEKNQYFYHPDHLGSTAYVTNALGEVSQHQEYAAFGEIFVVEHNNDPQTQYLYNGKEQDNETGLYYYGARYYDPRLSVWISVDPMMGDKELIDKSPYCYVWNNPIKFSDPTGEIGLIGAFVGVVIDVSVQTIEISVDKNKSFSNDFSLASVAVSAAAGATGVGLATKIAKIGKYGKYAIESAHDFAASMANQYAKDGEVNVKDALIDATFGKAAGDWLGKKVSKAVSKSTEAKTLANDLDRATRINKNNPRQSRQAKVDAAQEKLDNYHAKREIPAAAAASAAASNAASTVVDKGVGSNDKRKDD